MPTTTLVHQLVKLPYQLDQLTPQISLETMQYHYLKHHRGYVDTLNLLVAETEFENSPIEDIVRYADGAIYNNAAQVLNHNLYFLQLSPNPKSVPTGSLGQLIDRHFGSFDNFKQQIIHASVSLFGSGWVWLAVDRRDQPIIMPMSNAGNPLREGYHTLMCIDVWEHAYYIDYRNRRADSVVATIERIDWRVVEDRFRLIRH